MSSVQINHLKISFCLDKELEFHIATECEENTCRVTLTGLNNKFRRHFEFRYKVRNFPFLNKKMD